jgi:hypothetical protein
VREIVVILMVTLASLAGGCATPRTIAVPAAPVPPAAPEAIDVTLFLIGDAGAPSSPEPVLEALRREVQRARSPVIIYLGDNIYPRGMPASEAPDRADAERRVNAQLAVPRSTGARARGSKAGTTSSGRKSSSTLRGTRAPCCCLEAVVRDPRSWTSGQRCGW